MLLEDSPYGRKIDGIKLDTFGVIFLVFWIVTLQVVLDKGNDADWFGSTWVCWLTAISVVSCVLFFISQFKNHKNALIDLEAWNNTAKLIDWHELFYPQKDADEEENKSEEERILEDYKYLDYSEMTLPTIDF